jgi:cbb3-type cytochrome oxidase subunit 1
MNTTTDRQLQDNAEAAARRWIVIALVYFVAAVSMGVVMGASHDFRLKPVHVHANLLGWVSMALMGLVYRLYPSAAASRLAGWHFVLYQLALPAMLGGLAALMFGQPGAEPVVGVASVVMLVAVFCFALAVWLSGRRSVVHLGQAQTAA